MKRCKLLAAYAPLLLDLALEVTAALADGTYWESNSGRYDPGFEPPMMPSASDFD